MRIPFVLAACLALPACGSTRSDYGYGYDYGYGDREGYGRAESGYVGVSGLYSFEQFDTFPLFLGGTPISSTVDDSPGVGVRAGYRFTPQVAVEAAVDRVIGHDVSIRVPGFGTVHEDLESWSAGVQAKYFLDDGGVQPYLLGGIGWTQSELSDLDDSSSYARVGAGVDIYLDRDVALFLEASWNQGGELEGVDLDHIDAHVGVMFWF